MPWPLVIKSVDLERRLPAPRMTGKRQQEREPGRVLPGKAAEHAGDHGHAVTADASKQSEDLRGADDQGLDVVQLGQSPVRADGVGELGRSLGLSIRLGGGMITVTGPARGPDCGSALGCRGKTERCDARCGLALDLGRHYGQPSFLGNLLIRLPRRLGPELLASEQDQTVRHQEHCGQDGLAKYHAECVLEH